MAAEKMELAAYHVDIKKCLGWAQDSEHGVPELTPIYLAVSKVISHPEIALAMSKRMQRGKGFDASKMDLYGYHQVKHTF